MLRLHLTLQYFAYLSHCCLCCVRDVNFAKLCCALQDLTQLNKASLFFSALDSVRDVNLASLTTLDLARLNCATLRQSGLHVALLCFTKLRLGCKPCCAGLRQTSLCLTSSYSTSLSSTLPESDVNYAALYQTPVGSSLLD